MWNDDGGYTDTGGGFDNTNNMFTSPAPQSGKAATKPRALAPVAIKQVLDCPEDGLKIKDLDVQIVKVVGIIRSIEKSSIKISYMIEDPTGTLLGINYLESDLEVPAPIIEDTYCVVIGSIRTQSGSKHVMIFNITPIVDFNEIMEHYLSVIHLPLKVATLDNPVMEQKPIKQEMLSSYGSANERAGGEINFYNIDAKHRRIYEIISRSESESGIGFDEIISLMSGKMTKDQIRNTVEHLVGEGHIFTTIDENHFKSTESPY